MNNEAYRQLDKEEIATKDHYEWFFGKFVLLTSNHPFLGKKADGIYIFEKVSLEDFRILDDNEIVNKEHFFVYRNGFGYLRIYRCHLLDYGNKASDVREKFIDFTEFNIYAKKA
jgi:hypothetical protein